MVANHGVGSYDSFTTSLDVKDAPIRENSYVYWSKKKMMPEAKVTPKFKKGEILIFQGLDKRTPVIFQKCLSKL